MKKLIGSAWSGGESELTGFFGRIRPKTRVNGAINQPGGAISGAGDKRVSEKRIV
jgi:hypothetical protein